MSRASSSAFCLGVLAVLLLQGCASPKTTAPPVEPPATFSPAGSLDVPDRWWTAFGNQRLNAVVDTATATNFTLRTAWERLQAARAVVDREAGALYPDLEASGRAEGRGGTDAAFAVGESFELGLSSVYEVDLWGRLRSRVEAERFRAEATRTDYQTAALSLSGEVVRTWVQLAEANSQRRLVQDQIETNETVLTLLENRFETGQIRSVDILRQRQLVESTREQRTVVESRIQVLEHQLAVLLGRSPQAGIEDAPTALPDLPPLPETGVPTDLIRRRPDVQSALNRLRAADRDLAAAISDQYPRLTLSASGATVAESATDLFQSWAYSFVGNLLAPIFRGGALRAEVDRTEAVRTQRLYEYGQTVLTAFQEVEDALAREKKQRERIRQLERQVELAQQAYEQLRRDRLSAERTLVEDRIALYRALAGSFETDREEEDR